MSKKGGKGMRIVFSSSCVTGLGAGGEKHRVAFLLLGLCMLWTVLANSPAGVFYPKYGARGLIKPDAPSVQRLFVVARKKKKRKRRRGKQERREGTQKSWRVYSCNPQGTALRSVLLLVVLRRKVKIKCK